MVRVKSGSLHTIHYMNGVIATEEDARSIEGKIRRITRQDVESHHNSTTPLIRVITQIGFILAGAFALEYARQPEYVKLCENGLVSKRERNRRLLIEKMGLEAIKLAILGYISLQDEKNQLAKETALKIKRDLQKSSHHKVTIVLHSQGADIGSRMFSDFTADERKRIRVITLGGMVSIPSSYAAKVINFRFKNDYVSTIAQSTFDQVSSGGGKITHLTDRWERDIAHDAEFYIAHRDVQRALRGQW